MLKNTLIGLVLWSCFSVAVAQEQGDVEAVAEQAPNRQGTFSIWEYQVENNTLLENGQIERTVYPYLGPDRALEDIESARVALETLYRDSGYPTVIVDLPQQNISEGIVRLVVTQGQIDRVRVSGTRFFSPSKIREAVPELSKGQVPNIPEVQRQVQALNRSNPDRSVTPVFRPGRTPGTVEVELKVKDQLPIHGDFEINDRDSLDTSRLRTSASLRYSNLWQRGHSASILYSTAPEDRNDVEVFSGTYVAPLDNDNVLAFYVVDTSSDVATVGTLGVVGDGRIYGSRLILPMTAWKTSYFHSFTLGADYKNFDEDVVVVSGGSTPTAIDYVNWLIEYRGTYASETVRSSFGMASNFGVRGFVNSEREFNEKRDNAKPNYFHANPFFDVTWDYYRGAEMFLGLKGAVASGPLVSNEQFSAGGVDSVRGYYESQILGDDGISAQLELRTPSLDGYFWEDLDNFRLHVFFDGAALNTQDTPPGTPSSEEIYGTGFGFRADDLRGFDASFDWAWALKDARDVDSGDSRAHFRIHYGF